MNEQEKLIVIQKLVDWAWAQKYPEPDKHLMVLAIAYHADALGVTECTIDEMCRWVSVPIERYRELVAELQSAGVITVLPTAKNTYQFILSGYEEFNQ